MTAITWTNAAASKSTFAPLAWVIGAFKTRRERRVLATLDHARLQDLGLTYRDARRESSRPIWDVPAHWVK